MKALILTWGGPGVAVPFQAIAQALVGRGHVVATWSHEPCRPLFERFGVDFRSYPTAAHYDAMERFGASEEEHRAWVQKNVMVSEAIGEDTAAAIAAEAPDVVIIDEWLLLAHPVVQASPVPAASLAHVTVASEVARARRNAAVGWALGAINAARQDVGLSPVDSVLAAIEALGPAIAATAPTFDPPASGSPVIQVGPIRPEEPQPEPVTLPADGKPLVVVSLSTTWMHQVDVLQRILDGFADMDVTVWTTLGPSIGDHELDVPANAALFEHLPHELVLPAASLLVTHAGHGTVMAGLAHGVPMLCMPLGRDQPANAARAAELGAATVLDSAAPSASIGAAGEALLRDQKLRETCRRLAEAVSAETRLDVAVETIERIAAQAPGRP